MYERERKSSALAKRWMPGYRQGGDRPAWRHPADVVSIIKTLQAVNPPEPEQSEIHAALYNDLIDIAWLHDILEDGKMEGGTPVSEKDLAREGMSANVIRIVGLLTHRVGEEKAQYLDRLLNQPLPVYDRLAASIVKCADRVSNLREGRETYKPARWGRYVAQTKQFIIPLAESLPVSERDFFLYRLNDAMR